MTLNMKMNILFSIFPTLVLGVLSLGQPVIRNSIGEYGSVKPSPKPYSFNYEITDEEGNTHFRREQSDMSGAVSGSYGYTHVNGLFRTVEYAAGMDGFKARVKSNEPGVGQGPSPADVQIEAEPAPPGLQGGSAAPGAKRPTMVHQGYVGKKG